MKFEFRWEPKPHAMVHVSYYDLLQLDGREAIREAARHLKWMLTVRGLRIVEQRTFPRPSLDPLGTTAQTVLYTGESVEPSVGWDSEGRECVEYPR